MTTKAELLWACLLEGKSLASFDLPERNGRAVIEGLVPSASHALGTERFRLGLGWEIRSIAWSALHFKGCDLRGLRIKDSSISNCSFDACDCSGWRVWNSRFEQSEFLESSLAHSSLTPLSGRNYNRFRDVTFFRSNMKDTGHVSAEMERCRFLECDLAEVRFEGTSFNNCEFSGELKDVVFDSRIRADEGVIGELPRNSMSGTDLTGAKLSLVMFNNLTMEDVSWPDDEQHMRFTNFAGALGTLVSAWRGDSDVNKRGLAAAYAKIRSLVPPGGHGVINRKDISDAAGERAAYQADALLRAWSN